MLLAWYACGAAALLCVVFGALSALTSRTYKFRGGMIQGVTGQMGSGKSLLVVARVLLPVAKGIARKHGLFCATTQRRVRRIIANFEVDLPYDGVPVVLLRGEDLWDHLLELATDFGTAGRPALDAVIIIDEAHLYVTSDKMKLSPKARYVCSMLRKLNAELWWVSQHPEQLHVALRRHTSMCWTVHQSAALWTLFTGAASKWHVGVAWPMKNGAARLGGVGIKPLQTVRYRRSKRVMAAYNSFDLIVPADDAGADLSRDEFSARRLRSVPAYLRELPPPAPNEVAR